MGSQRLDHSNASGTEVPRGPCRYLVCDLKHPDSNPSPVKKRYCGIWRGRAAIKAYRIRRKRLLSQARMRLKLYPAAVRIAFAASPARPLEEAASEMALFLHVADEGFDGGSAAQLSFNGAEDPTLLAGDEDAPRLRRVVVRTEY
jgi:hypothetical protein